MVKDGEVSSSSLVFLVFCRLVQKRRPIIGHFCTYCISVLIAREKK
jgi:hypothetical protein